YKRSEWTRVIEKARKNNKKRSKENLVTQQQGVSVFEKGEGSKVSRNHLLASLGKPEILVNGNIEGGNTGESRQNIEICGYRYWNWKEGRHLICKL
ncbi:unnamed protein product, partial [Dovyalis caffra]